MFGQNPVAQSNENDDGSVRVVKGSPFYTIQGEGPYAGRPAVFVRLHGCPLRCWFCDTQFSDEDDPSIGQATLGVAIGAMLNEYGCDLVVITGGEPARWHLATLIHTIRQEAVRPTIQIETAGILWKPWMRSVDIVVSPKTPKIDEQVAQNAIAFKYIVGSDVEVTANGWFRTNTQDRRTTHQLNEPLLASPIRSSTPIYVSPCDEYDEHINAVNKKRVAEIAMKHGYFVSLQMHKLLDLP